LAAVDMGHATKAFVSVSASPSSRCRIASSSLFFFLVFTIFVIRDWAVRLRKAPQAHNWYFHASSATKKIIRHFSLGVESIERELKMLEEVHKGETYVAFRMSRFMFALHQHHQLPLPQVPAQGTTLFLC
jgi:hypothetical protein